MITDRSCRRRLATLWLVGTGLAVGTLILFSHWFGDSVARAWTWLGATMIPTATVIVGVVMRGASTPKEKPSPVDPFAYRLAMVLSAAYVLLVLVALVQAGVAFAREASPLQALEGSLLYLTPVNGLVGLGVGAFFSTKH